MTPRSTNQPTKKENPQITPRTKSFSNKINELLDMSYKLNINKLKQENNESTKEDYFVVGNNFDPITGTVLKPNSAVSQFRKRTSSLEKINTMDTKKIKHFNQTSNDFFNFKSTNKISHVNDELKDNLTLTSSKKYNIKSIKVDGLNSLAGHSSVESIMGGLRKVKRPKSQSLISKSGYNNIESPKYVTKCHDINIDNLNFNNFISPF